MENDNAYLSHSEITFAVGGSSLVVTPTKYLVGPGLSEFEPIYCEADCCSGGVLNWSVVTVLEPKDFHTLAKAFGKMTKGHAATAHVAGISGELSIECVWNRFERVTEFKVRMQHWQPCEKGMMKPSVELEFWMEPHELDEPLAGLEAILEHIRVLRESDQRRLRADPQ